MIIINNYYRVVTGLRFKKVNRIIHLQIQEGDLLPRGYINASTVSWKPIANYSLLDRGIQNGKDYHTMSWSNRSMDLDDLIVDAGSVVTGIRYRVIGSHMNFEIQATEMDFATGKLLDPELNSHWISNDNTDKSSIDSDG